MIILQQQTPYLSLNQLENYELNDFSIITGLNGSGKTHLLKAINEGAIKIESIDQSGIIYYSYNDFNIFYDDLSKNNDLKIKSDFFANKSSSFSQNLINQRTTILSQYKLSEGDFSDLEYIIVNSPDSFRWSEEEIEIFEKKQLEIEEILLMQDQISGFSPKQNNLINFIKKDFKTINIREWLLDKENLIFRTQILNVIRNNNYNIEITNWDNSQIEKYKIAKIDDPNLQIHPMFGLGNTLGFDQNFLNFLNIKQNNIYLKDYDLLTIKDAINIIFEDIKFYFKNNISDDYLQFSVQVNGEEKILNQISVDTGFLNLQEIANAEKNYQISKEQNQYNRFKATNQDKNIHFFSEEEFFRNYGDSPIILLNEVLNEYDCNGYEFRQSQMSFYFGADINKQNITISLYNKGGNYTTTLDAISSGEKTLIALSFYLFKLQKNRVITNLLLLDEIDSALHPSMSKRLLDVLFNIFYKKMGIKIIISTHSPSTVALSPEESIFVMNKYSTPKIMKVSKDKALKELTIGVPSFSINYENRRQVFVESDYDANYYESLYNIYNEKLIPEISLNFISSGKTKINGNGIGISSCDQVVNIVNILRKAGNSFSWGIIDWDLKNKSSDYVKVLGNSERYSIENYLLDPLLLAILLWKENILKSEDFGFDKNEVYFNVLNFNQSQLQQIIDKIIFDLSTKREKNDLIESKNYTLCNGITLQLPTWYCKTQGHSLEENIIMKTYPQLESIRKKDESALKKAVISKVISNFKNLVSADLVDIFKSIQEE